MPDRIGALVTAPEPGQFTGCLLEVTLLHRHGPDRGDGVPAVVRLVDQEQDILRLDPDIRVEQFPDLPFEEVVVVEDNHVGGPGSLQHQLVRAALAAHFPEFLGRDRVFDHPVCAGAQLV